MNFVYPLFLVAGLVLALPIIIHLFNFRKFKRVYFPDIRFLKEIKENTNKRSKLKHLLILASRLLALASLVLAFAQPFFNKNNNPNRGTRCSNIYIDNSYSMDVQKNGISLLQLAKNKAKDIINAGSPKDKYQILTNDYAYTGNKLLDKEEALANINSISTSALSRTTSNVLQKQIALLQTIDIDQKQLIQFSDFQIAKCPLPILNESEINKIFIPIQASNSKNVSVDTAYFETPSIAINQDNNLYIRIKNYDVDNTVNTSVTVKNNDQVKTVLNLSLKPNETRIEKISYKTNQAGWQNLKIYCSDYPVNFDDTFFVSGNVNANYSVLIANEGAINPYINAAYRAGGNFRVENNNINTISEDKLKNYSLLILNNVNSFSESVKQSIKNYLNNGGSVLLFPSANPNLNTYNGLLGEISGAIVSGVSNEKMNVTSYAKEHALIKDVFEKIPENVDLPFATKHLVLQSGTFNLEQKLFTFSNGDGFMNIYKYGNGKFYLCTSPAESQITNFPTSYWFLPLLYKMAFSSSNEKINAYTIGKDAFVYIKNNKAGDNNVFHLIGNNYDAIPEQRNVGNQILLNLNNSTNKAGIYNIKLPNANDNFYVGLNFDRSESDLRNWTLSDMKNKANLKNAEYLDNTTINASAVTKYDSGMPGWKIFLIVALIFLLIEMLLIKFFK